MKLSNFWLFLIFISDLRVHLWFSERKSASDRAPESYFEVLFCKVFQYNAPVDTASGTTQVEEKPVFEFRTFLQTDYG